ncbi:hypothetical protein FGO68_gene2267 [Halteria grandinella]|uniref:UBC core domain-containing protein n=1 Tax=Halteria grandinella TaxID=5974 RepID=A0A8J8SYF2_HALGN|nr:hypothetical protein FGO68_gene2267 [Halteria grandinella]
MASTRPRRWNNETSKLQNDPIVGIYVNWSSTNNNHFYAKIAGPSETPYEGGLFNLELILTDTYPFEPPKFKFTTKIFHPNITKDGRTNLVLLGIEWTPAENIRTVLEAIKQLLQKPKYEYPASNKYYKLWRADPYSALCQAREWTETQANDCDITFDN